MLLCCRISWFPVILTLFVLTSSGLNPLSVRADDLRTFGDIVQLALPAAGLAGTFIVDDPEGRYQWAQAVGGGAATVQVWKMVAGKMRPDASERTSYPSGHTYGAFSGAAFIDTRYGHTWGIPAYALAMVTGFSRVDSDAHFWDDVIAGASTGMLFNWYFASPYSERFSLLPAPMGDGYGVKLTLTYGADQSEGMKKEISPVTTYPNYTYIFRFGPSWQNKNYVQAPRDSGTPFNFANYENIDEPISTSEIGLDVGLTERQKLSFAFAPFENRDRTISTEEFLFHDTVFPAGLAIRSAYRLNEIRAQYSYGLLKNKWFSLFLGGGIAWQEVDIVIQSGEKLGKPDIRSEVKESIFQPFLYLRSGLHLTDNIELFLEMDGASYDDNKILNLLAGLNYFFNSHWYAGCGYMNSTRQIDTSELLNEYQFEGVLAQIAYTF